MLMKHASQSVPRRARLVPRGDEDRFEIVKTGHRNLRLGDMYVRLLAASWQQLLCLIVLVYLSTNVLFALAYLAIGNGIENAKPGSFSDAFFFSVQTMSTIGYGKMAPVGIAANLLVTLQVLTAFGFFAVVTGLVFSKFSRPTARVLFSNVDVICPYEGAPHFMLRLANERSNRIVDATIHMFLLRKEVTKEGHKVLVFSQFTSLLAIVRSKLDAAGIVYEYLDGQTNDRKTPVERFQTDPKVPVFLISLKAGGTGLNLTAADYVFILDPWWNPAVEAQAISRAHRIGQNQKVFAYRMITKGTVEEKILELQASKRELAESIISEDQDFLKKLTRQDLEQLLA